MTRVIDCSPNVKRMDVTFWGMQRQREFANAVMTAFEGRAGYAPRITDQERARAIANEALAAVKEISEWCETGDEMAFFGQVLFSLLGMATVERMRKDRSEKAKEGQQEKFDEVLMVVEEDGKERITKVRA